MKIRIQLWCFLFQLVFGSVLFSQAYNFNYLTIQEGLPQSQAFSIVFDSNQYAWIGTQGGGLCRYNGEAYNYYTKKDSLISNRVYCLKQIDDQIWIGQKGGVTVFDLDGKFRYNYRLKDNSIIVTDIIFYDQKYLVASNEGMFYVDKVHQLIPFLDNPNIKERNIHNLFVSKDSALWLCTNKGLLSYDNPFGGLTVAKGLTNNHVECAALFNGQWVIGTYKAGLNFYNKSKVFQKDEFKVLNDKIILSLFVSESNELWIGTMNNGIYLYNEKDKTLKNFNATNGLSGNHVKTIASDYWDNVWIGTSGGGVSIFQNSPFIEYNSSSGLNGDYVFSVLNDSQDNLWLGTDGKGVMRINDTSKVLFDEDYGFYSEKVKCIFEDNNNDIWFGTEGKGIGFFSNRDNKDTVYAVYNERGLRGGWVKCFAQSKKSNQVFVGTSDGGIFVVNKNANSPSEMSFKSLKAKEGDLPHNITDLHFDNKERLWFTSVEGEYGYFFKGKVTKFREIGKSFRNITIQENCTWLGSKDDGVLKLLIEDDSIKTTEWIVSTTSNAIQSNNIYQLCYYNGQLWVGTEKGLDRLDLDSNFNITKTEHFGYEEGFEGVETNINAEHVDRNGNLWFGTVDGLFVYKGRDPNLAQRKPPVLKLNDFQIVFESIEKTVYADSYEKGDMVEELLLPYNKNHISIQFDAIHYAYTKNIRFRWKLDGVDPDWTPSTTVNIATYPNLLPGEYTFYVQTAINDNWEQAPLELSFSIDQPYWDKFWFKFAYYTFAILIIVVIILVILYRQKRKNKALNEKLILEKNLLELEQKALRLQMNPHFIFNVLNSIHNLIILNDSDKARYSLSKFSKLMRRVLENSREKFIAIDDEIETLKNYVQLERLTSNLVIDLKFEFDEELDTSDKILPPLIIQPFIENAIVHGLQSANHEGEIIVAFKLEGENILACMVSDNGIGRERAKERKAQKDAQHKSTALKVVQERLANLNQQATFTPFEIIDLKNQEGKVEGTKVVIRLLI